MSHAHAADRTVPVLAANPSPDPRIFVFRRTQTRQPRPRQGKNGRLIAFCTPALRALVATRHGGCAPIAALDSERRGNILERTMNKSEKLADLRHFLAHYSLPPERPAISL